MKSSLQSRSAFPNNRGIHTHLHMLTLSLLVQPLSRYMASPKRRSHKLAVNGVVRPDSTVHLTPRRGDCSRPGPTERCYAADGGCGRLGQGKERKEALHRRPVALDLEASRAQRLVECSAFVNQRGQRARIGLDGRVGPVYTPAGDLEAPFGDHGPEVILPEPQLVASVEPSGGLRVEHRPEGKDQGIDPYLRVSGPRRGAGTPAPQA
jgi:hypothetical protein